MKSTLFRLQSIKGLQIEGALPEIYGILTETYGKFPETYRILSETYGSLTETYGILKEAYGTLTEIYGITDTEDNSLWLRN